MHDVRRGSGRVYLVGAGPGDPELITRAGLKALWAADVVAYDRLVAPELLREAPADAERIDVGKRPGGPAASQADTNALLVARALAGATVVRLKGGDPYVFGRGGEEALALRAAGVPFECIPGVTSATSAAAAAGIPVTHRGVAASVAVVTPRSNVPQDWSALARVDTLVLMMSIGMLEPVANELIAAGRSPGTPVAIVEAATTPAQRVVETTLAEAASVALRERVGAPATVIVGDVVSLRAQIAGPPEAVRTPSSA